MKTVYLALGSNIGNREGNLQAAIDLLDCRGLKVTALSTVYETEPVGFRDQPWFLNMVVEAQTSLLPLRLLAHIQKVEERLGRERKFINGPRTIDIDILLYGEFVLESCTLAVPHPRMTQRRFVLKPLVELAGKLRHPVSGRFFTEYLAMAPPQSMRKSPLALRLPRTKT